MLTFVPVIVLISISMIGLGLAYNSTVSVESNIIGSYCSIVGEVDGSPVNGISIIVDDSKNPPIYNLSFASTSGTQETLLLNYHHSLGTSLVLSMSFIVSGIESENLTIYCHDENGMVGSTVLFGIGNKSGTISGIVLGFGIGETDGNSKYRFEIQGINSINNPSIQMSFSVYPLEASS